MGKAPERICPLLNPVEHQGFEMDEDFARVEIVYPAQGKVVVRWLSDRRIETMRFGAPPDLPPGTPVE